MEKDIIRQDNGYVSTILFNRPAKKNALNAEALFSLGEEIKNIQKEDKARVIVLRGAGDKDFSSGIDLSCKKKEIPRTIQGLEYCLNVLANCLVPIISMIHGPAIGAGLDIAVSSDYRIATKDSTFGAPLVKLGRIYYYTAIERLLRLVNFAAAKELLLFGELISSRRAMEIGLVNKLADRDEIESITYLLAEKTASENSIAAVKATKRTMIGLMNKIPLDPELEDQLRIIASNANAGADALEGVNAILEKRKPLFTER